MGFDRLPADILFHIFTLFSSAKDLCKCSMVCKRWNNVLEEDRTWLQLLERTAPFKYRSSDLLSTLSGSKAKLIAFENAWNSNDCSQNINLQENKLTLHRKPVAQCTDAIRGKCGYLYGEHYWTVTWHGPKFGSNAVVGVATEKEVVHKKGYCGLLGSSCESWGWDISKGVLRHEDDEFTTYPKEDIEVRKCRSFTYTQVII